MQYDINSLIQERTRQWNIYNTTLNNPAYSQMNLAARTELANLDNTLRNYNISFDQFGNVIQNTPQYQQFQPQPQPMQQAYTPMQQFQNTQGVGSPFQASNGNRSYYTQQPQNTNVETGRFGGRYKKQIEAVQPTRYQELSTPYKEPVQVKREPLPGEYLPLFVNNGLMCEKEFVGDNLYRYVIKGTIITDEDYDIDVINKNEKLKTETPDSVYLSSVIEGGKAVSCLLDLNRLFETSVKISNDNFKKLDLNKDSLESFVEYIPDNIKEYLSTFYTRVANAILSLKGEGKKLSVDELFSDFKDIRKVSKSTAGDQRKIALIAESLIQSVEKSIQSIKITPYEEKEKDGKVKEYNLANVSLKVPTIFVNDTLNKVLTPTTGPDCRSDIGYRITYESSKLTFKMLEKMFAIKEVSEFGYIFLLSRDNLARYNFRIITKGNSETFLITSRIYAL